MLRHERHDSQAGRLPKSRLGRRETPNRATARRQRGLPSDAVSSPTPLPKLDHPTAVRIVVLSDEVPDSVELPQVNSQLLAQVEQDRVD